MLAGATRRSGRHRHLRKTQHIMLEIIDGLAAVLRKRKGMARVCELIGAGQATATCKSMNWKRCRERSCNDPRLEFDNERLRDRWRNSSFDELQQPHRRYPRRHPRMLCRRRREGADSFFRDIAEELSA